LFRATKDELIVLVKDKLTFESLDLLDFKGEQKPYTGGFLRFCKQEDADQVLAMRTVVCCSYSHLFEFSLLILLILPKEIRLGGRKEGVPRFATFLKLLISITFVFLHCFFELQFEILCILARNRGVNIGRLNAFGNQNLFQISCLQQFSFIPLP
jgi:hypothetical protein